MHSRGRDCSEVPAVPVYRVLELLERNEDEHRRRLQPRPRGQPALEHEHRALVAHALADHLQRRLALRAGRGHDAALEHVRGRAHRRRDRARREGRGRVQVDVVREVARLEQLCFEEVVPAQPRASVQATRVDTSWAEGGLRGELTGVHQDRTEDVRAHAAAQ